MTICNLTHKIIFDIEYPGIYLKYDTCKIINGIHFLYNENKLVGSICIDGNIGVDSRNKANPFKAEPKTEVKISQNKTKYFEDSYDDYSSFFIKRNETLSSKNYSKTEPKVDKSKLSNDSCDDVVLSSVIINSKPSEDNLETNSNVKTDDKEFYRSLCVGPRSYNPPSFNSQIKPNNKEECYITSCGVITRSYTPSYSSSYTPSYTSSSNSSSSSSSYKPSYSNSHSSYSSSSSSSKSNSKSSSSDSDSD